MKKFMNMQKKLIEILEFEDFRFYENGDFKYNDIPKFLFKNSILKFFLFLFYY